MRGEGRTILLVILDGVADRPVPELGAQTPLEAAATPHLDRLATAGVSGIVDVGAPGTPLSSDRAHSILFGYRPTDVPGRGVLEARGFDLDVPPDAVACSASFGRIEAADDEATDDRGWTITDRHVPDAYEACADATERIATFDHEAVDVTFEYTWKNRGIVTLAPTDEAALSAAVTDTDPFEVGLPVVEPALLADAPDPTGAERTADALAAYTRWSVDRLADAPVDVVLSKWAGEPTDPQSFESRHGMSARALTPKPVLQGLGETLGMTVEHTDGPYPQRIEGTLAALESDEFVHLHLPEPDEVAHDDTPSAKRDEIEAIDAALEPLVNRALEDSDLVVAVTADHTTPSRRDVVHAGDPVPMVVHGETVRMDSVEAVGERPAASGGLSRIRGRDVTRLLRAQADRVLLDGLRRSPEVPDYPTTDVTPLDREP